MKHDEDEDDLKSDVESETPGWVYSVNIFFHKYGSHVLLAFSLCLLGFVIWRRYQSNQIVKQSAAWDTLAQAQTKIMYASNPGRVPNANIDFSDPAQSLRNVASTSDLPAVRAEAYLMLGQYYLDAVNRGHYGVAEKLDVGEALRQAEAAYTKIMTEFKDQPAFYLKARMGLARVAQDKNDWDAAVEIFKSVAAEAPGMKFPVLGELAQEQSAKIAQFRQPIAFAPALPSMPEPATHPATAPGTQPASAPAFFPDLPAPPATMPR